MNINKIIENKISIYVRDRDEYKELCILLHEMGKKWNDGQSYIPLISNVDYYKNDLLMNVYDGTFTPMSKNGIEVEYIPFSVLKRDNIIDDILRDVE